MVNKRTVVTFLLDGKVFSLSLLAETRKVPDSKISCLFADTIWVIPHYLASNR